jgi:hypothetical protein
LPPKNANILNDKTKAKDIREKELLFFRELNGTLYLPEANKKKRDLLTFFYVTIEKLNIYADTEITSIRLYGTCLFPRLYMEFQRYCNDKHKNKSR